MSSIQVFSGRLFDIANPDPQAISPLDIAVALSRIPRFNGHTELAYTVGQHSTLASHLVRREFAREALLHDAAEAYLGDITRPLRLEFGAAVHRVEEPLEWAVAERFKLTWPWPDEVHRVDDRLLATEARDLLKHCTWSLAAEPYPDRIFPWKPRVVLAQFVARFEQLFPEVFDPIDRRLLPRSRKQALAVLMSPPSRESKEAA